MTRDRPNVLVVMTDQPVLGRSFADVLEGGLGGRRTVLAEYHVEKFFDASRQYVR